MQFAENQTAEELEMRPGDVILAICKDFSLLEAGKNLSNYSMSQQRATTSEEVDSKEMEQVKKLEIRGNGREKTKEYVLFRGDAVFVTEMNVVCLSGPVTGEEHFTVTLRTLINMEMNYMIGKSVKLGSLIQDFRDRRDSPKPQRLRFVVHNKLVSEDQTPEELGLINGDLVHVVLSFP